ncbi:MAG: hypothetical protein R3F60_00445 [bacterium]
MTPSIWRIDPGRVIDERFTFDDFPWPMQNCPDLPRPRHPYRLRLLNQEMRWRTHRRQALVLHRLRLPEPGPCGRRDRQRHGELPSSINESALRGAINLLLPNSDVAIYLTGLDLDIDVELGHTSSTLTGDLDLRFNVGDVEIDTFIVDIANYLGLTDAEVLSGPRTLPHPDGSHGGVPSLTDRRPRRPASGCRSSTA